MKKILLSLVLAIALIVCGVSFVACDFDEEPSGNSADFEYTLSDDQSYYILADVTKIRNTSVVVPETYNGLPVKSIYKEAFENSSITSITIPDSVTSIGYNAFYKCSSLTAVYITDLAAWCNISFENAYSNPLWYAKNLYLNNELVTDLVIPDTVTKISDYAFYNYSKVESVTIGNGVTSIGDCAFGGCSKLASVTIGNAVTGIGGSAFGSCSSLTSVVIPSSVTSIGDRTFKGCTSLTSVSMGNGVTNIGNEAFYECFNLTSVYITDLAAWCNIVFKSSSSNPLGVARNTDPHNLYLNNELVTDLVIPDTVTEINADAFYKCSSITSVTIGSGVISIGTCAFRECYSLTSAIIGDNVTSIGEDAFYKCNGLTSITIPSSVTSIGDKAFCYCSGLSGKDHVYYKGTEEQWRSIKFGSDNGYIGTPTYLGSK